MANILIIDPSRSIRNTLKDRLEYEGYKVATAEDPSLAESQRGKLKYDLVLYGHPDSAPSFKAPWIKISADDSATESIESGAADFIRKPVDMNKLLDSIRRCIASDGSPTVSGSSSAEKTGTRAQVAKGFHADEMVGSSAEVRKLKKMIEKVGPTDARVLIMGPNGTGKELVARWLHATSRRVDAPFVEVNCAAIPSELIESELFGHEKGAFTSAIKQRKGKFEQASGGTLFLDEIGDMSLSAQAKILRVLQEKKLCRVGSDRDVEVDVRIIAATNKDLLQETVAGNFREDLYHRLSVIVINVPTLHDRIEDVPLLVEHFARQICGEYDMPLKTFSRESLTELKRLTWHGNIRQLRNVVERLIILSEGEVITPSDIRSYAHGLS